MWCICRYGWNLNMAFDQKSHKSFQQVQTQTLLQEHFCSQSKAGIGFKSIPACQNFRCITGSCWHKKTTILIIIPLHPFEHGNKHWRDFRHKPENPPGHRRIASAFQDAFQFTRRQSVKFRLKQSDWKKKEPLPLIISYCCSISKSSFRALRKRNSHRFCNQYVAPTLLLI